MDKPTYEEQAKNLSKAIDIAITSFQDHPPAGFDRSNIDHITNTYLGFKNDVLNPKSKFKNRRNLKITVEEVFTYFQEANGVTVNVFWKNIKEANLPYSRKNRLGKILKLKKIKNKNEYNLIVDVMVPYEQEGLLSKEEIIVLNQLLKDFEQK